MSTAPAFSPGPCTTRGPGGRQRLEMHARALVAAVLRPHHREQAELQQVGLAAHQLLDALVLVRLDAVAFENGAVDHCHTREAWALGAWGLEARRSAFTADASTTRPSALPSASSEARSGCGIRPTTLRWRLQMPAMLLSEPFGFQSAPTSPAALVYRKMTCRFASSSASTSGGA